MKKLISLKLVGILLALSASGVNAQVLCGMQQPGQPCSMAVMPMMMYGSVQAGVQGVAQGVNIARRGVGYSFRYDTKPHNFVYEVPGVARWNYGSGPHYQGEAWLKGVPGSGINLYRVPTFPPQHYPQIFYNR